MKARIFKIAQYLTWVNLTAWAAHAATITVTQTNDSGAGSLRQAIQSAAPGDTINLSVTGVITLTNGELLVTKNVTIAGTDAANLAISGNDNSRVFEITSNAAVSISGLTVRNGHASDATNSFHPGGAGGGIYNAGALTLTSCTVSSNRSGAGFGGFGSGLNGGNGGGIYNATTLTLNACTISGNSGGGGGIGLSGEFGGSGGRGGGVYNDGTLILIECNFSSNSGGTGGIGGSMGHGGGGDGGSGGAIFNSGTLTLNGCSLSANSAGKGGNNAQGASPGTGGSGGGVFQSTNASLANLRSTLVAQNFAGIGGTPAGPLGAGPDLAGPFTSQGHNMIGQTNGSTGLTNGVNFDMAGTTTTPIDPMLGPLQDN